MAEIQEINETIVAVGKIDFQKDFKAKRLYELDQEKARQEDALTLAMLNENSLE